MASCSLPTEVIDGVGRPLRSRNPPQSRPTCTRYPTVKRRKRFTDQFQAVLGKSKGLGVRAGTGDHRFTGIWFVFVKDRVLVRSWTVKAHGWNRAFLKEPRGTIQIANEIPVRAVRIRSPGLRNAVDRAYLV